MRRFRTAIQLHSITHRYGDVYKRQTHSVHSTLSHLDDIVEAYLLDRTIDLLTGCLKPVSYTHLDVYKRQVWDVAVHIVVELDAMHYLCSVCLESAVEVV